jgi:hypothetical protein
MWDKPRFRGIDAIDATRRQCSARVKRMRERGWIAALLAEAVKN